MKEPDFKRISAVVLAAGQSRRMGQNKLLMPFNGVPLLTRALDFVAGLGFGENIIVVSEETADLVKIPQGFVTVINKSPESGQASSVKLGVNAASLDYYMFFLADMPFLDKGTVLRLVSEIEEGKIVVPYAGEAPASPVIFHKNFRSELLATTGDKGGRAVISKHKQDCKAVLFKNTKAFTDVNTPGEYEKYIGF